MRQKSCEVGNEDGGEESQAEGGGDVEMCPRSLLEGWSGLTGDMWHLVVTSKAFKV